MKRFRKNLIGLVTTMLVAFVALLISPSSINAQADPAQMGRPSPFGIKQPENARQPSVRERQLKIEEMEREARRRRTPEEERLALEQIADDFEQIQVINNKMMAVVMPSAAPDYSRISSSTSAIRTRAIRLRDNLGLATVEQRKSKTKPRIAPDAAATKAELLSLDHSIVSFIKNPIFKNPRVVDAEQANNARRDLENIIDLSQLISKHTAQLSKLSNKPR